jgi:iron(III) transport system substrate-binding protein
VLVVSLWFIQNPWEYLMRVAALAVLCCVLSAGCLAPAEREVVVYTALDEEFSRPIFEQFEKQTGIVVRAKFDVESTKSVQLAQAIMAESRRPRCDVFWNNEIVNMLRLADEGLLASYDSPRGKKFPPQFRDAEGRWYGFAARARVLVVNTQLVSEAERPTSLEDLIDPRWKGQVAIAKPLAGTTATHAACLFAAWGPQRAGEFFEQVKTNCQVLGGNKQVARAVADGLAAFGLTDTDDALVEYDAGAPVAIVFPDQQREELPGALLIPNTLSIVRGAPHREEAEQLVEYLLSAEVERRLAAGPSAQLPVGQGAARGSAAEDRWRQASGSLGSAQAGEDASPWKFMPVDFAAAAKSWNEAAKFLRDQFATAE